MSLSDGLLDPALQQEAAATGGADDVGHHLEFSHPLSPTAATVGGVPGGHSIQDIQASQILSHFQFAPAGSVSGASLPPLVPAAAAELDTVGSGGGGIEAAGSQQQSAVMASQAFDPYAAFTSPGLQPGDGAIESSTTGGVSQLGGTSSHLAQPHGPGQQQQHLASDYSTFDGSQQLQSPHQQSYASAGALTGTRNGQFLHQQQPLDPALNKRPYNTFTGSHAGDDGTGGTESDGNDADVDDIQDVAYLRREIKRLRRALRHSLPSVGGLDSGNQSAYGHGIGPPQPDYYTSAAPPAGITGGLVAETSAAGAKRAGKAGGRRAKKVDETDEEEKRKRNALTGKRETTPRHHALNKAIRDRMKELMGVGADERLPSPHDPQPGPADPAFLGGSRIYHRPDWKAGVKNEANKTWLEGVARAVINDGWQALRSVPPVTTKDVRALIPAGDLDFELAFKAARTAFSNFTKKWVSQTDPAAIQKAIIDAKRGRRWARKDLKQKKRSKAALDDAYASIYSQEPHPHILKLDYMSSECSSEGDDAGLEHGRLPEGEWERLSGRDPNPDLNKGKGEKVLEIRTPRWRSERLTDIFGNLDDIASLQAKAIKGNFYTAPALKRFKLKPLRDLPVPSLADLPLEPWEFDPVWLGQPTERADDVRRKLGLPPSLAISASGSGGAVQQQQQQQQQGLDPAFVYGIEMMQAMEGYGQQLAEGGTQ